MPAATDSGMVINASMGFRLYARLANAEETITPKMPKVIRIAGECQIT